MRRISTIGLAAMMILGTSARGFAALPVDEFGPNDPDEPVAARFSLAKAATFLDASATSWTRKHKCGSCHTNYSYMIARPALSTGDLSASREVRAFFEGRVAHWDDADKNAKPKWDAEVVATAVALALNDAATTGKLAPVTRKALDRIWTLQRPNGGWNWLKCGWPPYENDDYYGATFAALGVAAAPDAYRDTPEARRGLERLRRYFRETPSPTLHHDAFLLWASTKLDDLMTPARKSKTIASLLALQRADGGWNLPSLGDWKRKDGTKNDKQAPSDGYGTGFVVFILRQAGVPADDPAIVRGVAWLKSNQRASGRWFTRSLNDDDAHYIAHAGTAFAAMALKACGVAEE